jgi:hypothetical protein
MLLCTLHAVSLPLLLLLLLLLLYLWHVQALWRRWWCRVWVTSRAQ